MNAIETLVEQRNALRNEADSFEALADRLVAEAHDRIDQADLASEKAYDIREEVKRYDVCINGLGGEPKSKPKLGKPFAKKAKAAA